MQRILTLLVLVAISALLANGCSDNSPTNTGLPDEDLTPPAAPVSLTAYAKGNLITLAWIENSEADLEEYYIYRSTNDSDYEMVGNIDRARFQDAIPGHGLFHMAYRVTAMDHSGKESARSMPAVVTIDTSLPHWAEVKQIESTQQ